MLNILDLLFLGLFLFVTFTGIAISHYEKHVPDFIIKSFKYGSFAYQGSGANYLQIIEIPKALYRHFYVFSSILSATTFIYATLVYFFDFTVHRYVIVALKLLLEQDTPSVSVLATMVTLLLITIQCTKRCYETYCVQVFAKSSKMNLSHYVAGIVHYFGVIVAAIGQAPLFCGNQNRDKILWTDLRTSIIVIPCSVVFFFACYDQYKSNLIFANLRKDKKSGKIVTEEHKIPHGRLFETVSSPHRLCEIIMYTQIFILLPTKTMFFIYVWVLTNQIQSATHAHIWYKKTFKDYPQHRWAIMPGVY